MSLFDSDQQASSSNLFQSEGDALTYLVSNGVGSPETAEVTVQSTDSDVLDSVLNTPDYSVYSHFSPAPISSPTAIKEDPFLSPYSPISPAPLSDYFKVENPTPADYQDNDVFKSDSEQEDREQALLDQLHQLTSDTKPEVKPEFRPPLASEYIEQEEQMEVDINYGEQKLKQEKVKEEKKDTKNFLGENMVTCTGCPNCPDPSHQSAGIFTNSHQHQYSSYLPHIIHLMVMLYCIVIDAEDTLMSCLLCSNAVAMHFDRMYAHVKHVHGHTFGNPQTKEEIVNRIRELKAKRYESNHVVALLCGVCRVHCKTQFDLLVHITSHTSIAEQCHYCPLCLIPLLHLTLNEHFAQAHNVNCCGEAFVSLKQFLTHLTNHHASFFRSNLSYPVLKNFYLATVQCRPRLLWEKSTQIMFFPEVPNYGMPAMYSEAFEKFISGLTPSARTVAELLADTSEYEREVREQVEGRWTKLTSHYIWLTSTVIQTGIAALYRTAFARLSYVIDGVFEHEVQLFPDPGPIARCRKCKDAVSHSGTPDLCIMRNLVLPQILEMRLGVVNRYCMSDFGAVWVGAYGQCYDHAPITTVSILNLSDTKRVIRYPTHYVHGNKCVVKVDETVITRFHDYFVYLEEVLSLLPRHTFSPVFVEFFLLKDVSMSNENIRRMCETYLSYVDKLRVKYFLNLIVLCPIGHFMPNMSPMEYVNNKQIAVLATVYMTALCRKTNVPVVPLVGLVSSVVDPPALTSWSRLHENREECLWNGDGTPTRELLKRIGRVVDDILVIHAKGIRKSGRYHQYITNVTNQQTKRHHYRYSDSVLPVLSIGDI